MSVLVGQHAGPLSFAVPAEEPRPWWRRLFRGASGGPRRPRRAVHAEVPAVSLPDMDDVHADLRRAEDALANVADREELLRCLEDCERARAAFLTQLHHELRTPTTTLMGYLEVLRDGDGGVLTPAQRWMLARAEEGALRLAGVLNELRQMEDLAARAREAVQESARNSARDSARDSAEDR